MILFACAHCAKQSSSCEQVPHAPSLKHMCPCFVVNVACFVLQEMMLSVKTRRKLAVHITAAKKTSQVSTDETTTEALTHAEAAAAADAEAGAAADAEAGAAAGAEAHTKAGAGQQAAGKSDELHRKQNADHKNGDTQQKVQQIQDIWAFKRTQMLYPSSK